MTLDAMTLLRQFIREAVIFRRRPGADGTTSVTKIIRPDAPRAHIEDPAERLQSLGMKQKKISSGAKPNLGQLVVDLKHLDWGYGKLIDLYMKNRVPCGTIAWKERPSGKSSNITTDVPFERIEKASDFIDGDLLEPITGVPVMNRTSQTQFFKK